MHQIGNESASLAFNGFSYSAKLPGFSLDSCQAKLYGGGFERPLPWSPCGTAGRESMEFRCSNELGDWRLAFHIRNFKAGLSGIEISFDGVLKAPLADLKLTLLSMPSFECSHVLSQGARMGGCKSISLPTSGKTKVEGHHQLMISKSGRHLQLSFPLRQPQPALFTMDVEGAALRSFEAAAIVSNFGGLDVKAPPLRLVASSDGFSLMEDWADENSELRRDFRSSVQPGWNSWDYYRWTITEEEVLKNAEFIARDPVLSKKVKRIIVDDGWQYCYGEWEANSLFPSGMASLAKELSKMGFEPGLWFAPTIVEPHCRIAQTGYEMLAMGDSGQPCLAFECMRRYGFVLDPTQEKVRRHLGKLFARYADMGYKYFKLDFMGATLKAKRFADASVPRSEIARLIVEPIAEAVKGKSLILGCNYHFDGGNKFVDSVRSGADIHATWSGLTHNVTSVAARFWANKRLWINDPDFALCRGLDTSDDPELTKLLPCLVFVPPEAKTLERGWLEPLVDLRRPQLEMLLSIVLAAGGAVNLSDKMPRLNASGLDLARRAVSAESGEAARPLDLFENERPSIWLQKLSKGWRALLLNWSDEPAEMSFDLKAHEISVESATDFWRDTSVPMKDGTIVAKLEPRSCLLVSLE